MCVGGGGRGLSGCLADCLSVSVINNSLLFVLNNSHVYNYVT